MVISMGHIVAFIQMASADKHAIRSLGEGPEYKFQVDSPGAHDANKPHFRGILKSGNSSQVSSAVGSPMADKPDDPWLEFMSCTHSLSTPLCNGIRYTVLPWTLNLEPSFFQAAASI
jgi:hypothetical protein